MIPYTHNQEKETLIHYANLLSDKVAKDIIDRDQLSSSQEALHLANFYWDMVEKSNEEDAKTGESSEYILEKIIITFMAYFRSSGYESEWEEVTDKR
ncbi:hypothetical protein [Agaribacterium sp. ZY112]|uniref:hypothetical protein n=1 Tax=Agaribacterium sp. ZY112 TaxID=3233574 RepID=UPI003524AB22